MKVGEVVPLLIDACPTVRAAWQEHLEFWGDQLERGHYNDAAVIAHHLVERFERNDVSEFPATFAVIERCLSEGDQEVVNLVKVGVIEGIQNIASHRPFGSEPFLGWLGPRGRIAWDELCAQWEQLRLALASGKVKPSPFPMPDLDKIENPQLRQIVEQMYRKG
jgi:hypothetical protein